jgi:Skp family chaperone for outer membrane proteins
MQDVIKTIVETEKDVEKRLQEARNKAASLLSKADADISEKIRLLKQEEREKTAAVVDAAEKEAEQRLLAAEDEAVKLFEKDRSDPSGIVPVLVEKVVQRILSTVFDRRP